MPFWDPQCGKVFIQLHSDFKIRESKILTRFYLTVFFIYKTVLGNSNNAKRLQHTHLYLKLDIVFAKYQFHNLVHS